MATKPVPQALPIRAALDQSAPLAGLFQRVKDSNARFVAVQGLLPPPLRAGIRAGPLDEEGWSLLVANAGVAAKLRNLLPLLDDALVRQGWARVPIRVKIQGGG